MFDCINISTAISIKRTKSQNLKKSLFQALMQERNDENEKIPESKYQKED